MPLIDAWENDFFEEFTKLNLDNIGDYVRKNRKELIFLCESIEGLDKKIEEMLGEFIIKKAGRIIIRNSTADAARILCRIRNILPML